MKDIDTGINWDDVEKIVGEPKRQSVPSGGITSRMVREKYGLGIAQSTRFLRALVESGEYEMKRCVRTAKALMSRCQQHEVEMKPNWAEIDEILNGGIVDIPHNAITLKMLRKQYNCGMSAGRTHMDRLVRSGRYEKIKCMCDQRLVVAVVPKGRTK